MGTFYNSLEHIEEYKFPTGRYKGKTLEEIKEKEDCIEYLRWIRKKIKFFIKNPTFEKHKYYNIHGLKEIENYLIKNGCNIELTNYNSLEEDKLSNEDLVIKNLDTNKSFTELLEVFEDKILSTFDEKFASKKFIRSDYKDYLCLRYTRYTYIEILENQDKDSLIIVINNI